MAKGNVFSSLDDTSCQIEGDVIVDGTIVESKHFVVIGIINVTGDVRVTDEVTVTLSPGATLHVGKCLVLDEGSEIIVVVEGGASEIENEGSVLATYDASCSSLNLTERVNIERGSSFDECIDCVCSHFSSPTTALQSFPICEEER